jgi:predicted HTH transcriptional regulator
MPALRKPLAELTSTDIQLLIEDEWVEDELLEFKQSLSHTSAGKPDPWFVAQDAIGPGTKRDLLAEVVAMANSYGGDVVLGIVEADEKPPRAVGLNPLPKCVELASRLEHAARDLIKPQIPMLGVRGIPTDGASGVVVFRIPKSRSAPHRLEMKGIEKECYKRAGERTETMSMREIQDLTFSVSRGLAQTEQRLAEFQGEVVKRAREGPPRVLKCGFGVHGAPLSSDDSARWRSVYGVSPP